MNKTNIIRWLTLAGKAVGLVSGLGAIPFIDPAKGVVIFAAASILKDVINRIGDLVDDGKQNDSFKP
jgi:hypothetical protein